MNIKKSIKELVWGPAEEEIFLYLVFTKDMSQITKCTIKKPKPPYMQLCGVINEKTGQHEGIFIKEKEKQSFINSLRKRKTIFNKKGNFPHWQKKLYKRGECIFDYKQLEGYLK